MGRLRPVAIVGLIVFLLAPACAPPAASPPPASEPPAGATTASARGPARITIATFREIDFLPYSAIPGSYELRNIVNPGLSVLDDRGALRPVLAEAVPSLENGLWKLFPDGRMETTWKLRPGVTWHDGQPVTSDDLLFTLRVGRDRSTGVFGQAAYASVEDASAPDAQTVVVTWRQPYVEADQMFTIWLGWPMPRHLLEAAYTQEPATLVQAPFWTTSYVGSGPYRLKEFVPGLRVELERFDGFVLGKPKIEEVTFQYTPDPSTVMANIFSGTVDMTVGIGLTVDAVVDARERWRDGQFTFEFSDVRWFRLDPQFIDPNPAIVTDLRFRRALLHAIDRQEMTDTLQAGISPVAHTLMAPNQPDYAGIEPRVVKYEYDPRKAQQMIEELGYRRGSDGLLRDASGKQLEVEIAGSNEAVSKPMLSVANYWQRIGVTSNTFIVPPQRATDWQWRATFASFAMFTGTHDIPSLPALRGRQARTAENNYEVSGLPNWPRYRNAELDALVDKYFVTIPKAERIEVLTQINMHVAENLNTIGLYYFPVPYAVANRVVNVPVNRASRASLTWNAHLWDVRA